MLPRRLDDELNERFGIRPRNQHVPRHREFQRKKPRLPNQIRHRHMIRPLLDQLAECRRLSAAGTRSYCVYRRHPRALQRMGQQQFRRQPRLVHGFLREKVHGPRQQ